MLELPLNGRNFLDLAKLVPGVAQLAGSSQSNGLSINGQRANQIGFYFDGVDTRTETSGKPAFTPSIEAIQEFKIQQNAFAAEFGRSPAGINLTLRPGTNDFHGTLFEFLRNNALDARSFFSPQVDPLRRHQFGGVVSGPVIRNKTFFMGNYEGLRTRRATTLYLTLPTNAQREGNFAGGPQIFDPATYDAANNTRQPFAGNVIPQDRFGVIGSALLKYYPVANSPGSSAFNHVVSTSSVNDGDQFHGRIDHQFGSNDLLFGRYSVAKSTRSRRLACRSRSDFQHPRPQHHASGIAHLQPEQSESVSRGLDVLQGQRRLSSGGPQSRRNRVRSAQSDSSHRRLRAAASGGSGADHHRSEPFQPSGPRENMYSIADDFSWIAGQHSVRRDLTAVTTARRRWCSRHRTVF